VAPTTLQEYHEVLGTLLADPARPLADDEAAMLRALVRERRNGRRDRPVIEAPSHLCERADRIVALIGSAARDLRPRETQELDDVVAGRPPKPVAAPRQPVRSRRTGWPPR
jgi:hypothetical protein